MPMRVFQLPGTTSMWTVLELPGIDIMRYVISGYDFFLKIKQLGKYEPENTKYCGLIDFTW